MNDIKKMYVEVYNLLEANKNKKVSTVLPELVELMSKKASSGSDIGSTFIKNDDGDVTHIYCYYHKKWESVTDVEYGKKASNKATGLNTMCKEGVSAWSKQQRTKKAAEAAILDKLLSGEITSEDIPEVKAQIEEDAKIVAPRADGHGVDTVEEL